MKRLTHFSRFTFPLAGCCWLALGFTVAGNATEQPPLGPSGTKATYVSESAAPLRDTVVKRLVMSLGPVETRVAGSFQWLELDATKATGERFRVWLLANAYPQRTLPLVATNLVRYVLQEGDAQPREFVHRVTGAPVLPTTGAWEFLWPRPEAGEFRDGIAAPRIVWLGHTYKLESTDRSVNAAVPPEPHRIELLPDVLVGVPSNTRTRDDRRRYDGSDYELVRLTRDDYAQMIRAGMNCFRADAEQAGWIADEPVFVWGIGGKDVRYPEVLFRSTWLGPTVFLDEPAVHTRDQIVRPRLAKTPELRKTITPQVMLGEFTNLFHETIAQGAPWALINGLRARSDVDLGTLTFPQRNLYAWETMVASAAWQLTAEPNGGPAAIVFEPPGRVGARRTLPEMNMAYGCQIPVDNPTFLADLIFGFLRGAARLTDKNWGVSIYGGVDQADAPLLLTHAYDLGAKYFFFWDNYQQACVPFGECLALARNLQAQVASHPARDTRRLKRAAEVAILLPPGYDLGHVHMGRGNLWGLGELNLERTNRFGISYRTVMGNFFTEIERCLRLGVPFDLLWDLHGLKLDDYREVVRVREDGHVEVIADGNRSEQSGPRTPTRPPGAAPGLAVELADNGEQGPRTITARSRVTEQAVPVYYTTGTDDHGIYHNARVLWELYGPGEADYRALLPIGANPRTTFEHQNAVVELQFRVEQTGR
ncbi:MAG: hypothetical protein IT579_10225, partial [Verrucomicrobia subdivision 3 bacterium]|nr:hypothetical protein [Limisphaerales bacterium]